MAFLTQYTLFLAEWITIVGVATLAGVMLARARRSGPDDGRITIRHLNVEHDKILRAFDESPTRESNFARSPAKRRKWWWRAKSATPAETRRAATAFRARFPR